MNVVNNSEDFSDFEAKVDEVVKLLQEINISKSTEQNPINRLPEKSGNNQLQENDFIALEEKRYPPNSLNRATQLPETSKQNKIDKYTFMEQLEDDAKKRYQIRKERERIAQDFRKRGNDAFHEQKYERAIIMYTKAIDHIKDSPILYNNRALTYIKLKAFKRALMDCDHVLNKLDEKNLRSWLYKAIAYQYLNDEKNYENSIHMAKKHNPRKQSHIESFQDQFLRNNI